VTGSKVCNAKLPEIKMPNASDKPLLLSSLKTKSKADNWVDAPVYKLPHWSPTAAEKSESEDALDTDVTNKKFFYAQEYFVD